MSKHFEITGQGDYMPAQTRSYFAAAVDANTVQDLIDLFVEEVGEDFAQHCLDRRASRDRTKNFHMTIVSPREMNDLKNLRIEIDPQNIPFRITGIGKAHAIQRNENAVSYFLTCESGAADDLRSNLGLEPMNFHITIGFNHWDIHNVSKGKETRFLEF